MYGCLERQGFRLAELCPGEQSALATTQAGGEEFGLLGIRRPEIYAPVAPRLRGLGLDLSGDAAELDVPLIIR
jgi:hypothetical protein